MVGELDPVKVWQQHDAWLRARAAAWGWTPRFYVLPPNEYHLRFLTTDHEAANEGPFFYAEALSLAGPQRA
jgi:hypothetical protein